MLRALSTRIHRGYERLGDESTVSLLGGSLRRARSVPAVRLGSSVLALPAPKPAKKTNTSKLSHPIFSFFNARRGKKNKTTAKPEFARYLEYLKEGGMWDVRSNMPVIYYK